MKVVRKILYVIAGLLILCTILIVVCAYNPSVMEKIQGVIFRGRAVEVRNVTDEAASEPAEGEVSENTVTEEAYRMRSIEELGISEDALIKDMDSYNADCLRQITEHGLGEYSFENVIASEALVQEIYAKYSNKDYVSGYMDEALKEIGAQSYDMNLLVEELTDKRFRLTHKVVFN